MRLENLMWHDVLIFSLWHLREVMRSFYNQDSNWFCSWDARLDMLHVRWYMLHVRWYMLHVRWYMLHVRLDVLHVRWYMLHVRWYMLHVRWYMLHVRLYVYMLHLLLFRAEVSIFLINFLNLNQTFEPVNWLMTAQDKCAIYSAFLTWWSRSINSREPDLHVYVFKKVKGFAYKEHSHL